MTGRRRVLHVITRLIVGGAQENTVASAARIAPDRWDSALWTGPQTGAEGSLFEHARALGVEPVVLPHLVREIRPDRDALAVADLVRRLRRDRFDVVHTHSSKAGILGRIAARAAGVPVVVHTVHGWGFHDRMPAWRRRAFVAAERLLAPRTDRLVSVSEETTRIGLAHGIGRPEDYELVRSGIPLAEFFPDAARGAAARSTLGFGGGDVVVGSVGRLSAQKNPADFVELAVRLAPRFPSARFLYVGDGPHRAAIEARITGAGLEGRVVLAGLRRDVPDLLRAMDVFVLTSLWEGLPRVIPQALASGVPAVVYDVSGIREAVRDGENGWAVAPRDLDAMEARVAELLEDRERRRALGRRARETLDPAFTEDDMVRRLAELYDRLVAERAARR